MAVCNLIEDQPLLILRRGGGLPAGRQVFPDAMMPASYSRCVHASLFFINVHYFILIAQMRGDIAIVMRASGD
jgi:hypothetical protein